MFPLPNKRSIIEEPQSPDISAPGTTQERTIDSEAENGLIDEESSPRLKDQKTKDPSNHVAPSDNTVIQQAKNHRQQVDNLPSGPEVLLISSDAEEGNLYQQFAEVPTERFQKGPVSVHANLDPETEKTPLISSPHQPVRETFIEAEPIDHLSLEEKGYSLPEIVFIPFEDAVKDEVLHGWEDHWVAHGSYDAKKWGNLVEPKIDFVYLCKCK